MYIPFCFFCSHMDALILLEAPVENDLLDLNLNLNAEVIALWALAHSNKQLPLYRDRLACFPKWGSTSQRKRQYHTTKLRREFLC